MKVLALLLLLKPINHCPLGLFKTSSRLKPRQDMLMIAISFPTAITVTVPFEYISIVLSSLPFLLLQNIRSTIASHH